ncbi:hypothetical protein, partial [Antarctobacter heliothermus]
GTKGSGSGDTKEYHHSDAGLPDYEPHADDVMELMTQDIDTDASGGTSAKYASGGTYGDMY